jgi:hypothetical protein
LTLIHFIYNTLIQLILIGLIYYCSFKYSKKKSLDIIPVLLLVSFHLILTVVSSITTEGTHSDPPMYFSHAEEANSWFELFGVSSTFIRFLIYPLINYFQFNYLTIFIVFSCFSIYGYLLLYDTLNKFKPIKVLFIDIKYLILFSPIFHIWMSFLGKDGLTFMFTMLVLREFMKDQVNFKKLIIPILFLTFIRPYLVVFIFIALVLTFLTLKINTLKRFLLFFVIIFGSIFVSFQIFYLLDIDIFTFFSSRLDRVSYYSHYKKEGSFLDPKMLNTIEKLFAYLFRPLFYDAKGIMQIYISFENLFFFILFLKFLFLFKISRFKKSFKIKILFIYCLVFLLVNSYLIYNLGLVNRQKYMIFPVFLYILFFFHSQKLNARHSKYIEQ